MSTYVMLTTLTTEGAHTVHANPDRLAAVNEEVATFGCKVVAQYAVLGAFDFVTIIEAPDNENDRPPQCRSGISGHGLDLYFAGDSA